MHLFDRFKAYEYFDAWTDSLPAKHWAKYNLGVCYLGWNAAIDRLKQEFTDAIP